MFNPPPLPPDFGKSIICPFCSPKIIQIPCEKFHEHFKEMHKKKFITEACCEIYGYKLESPAIYLAHLCIKHPFFDLSPYFGEAIQCPFCRSPPFSHIDISKHVNQEHAELFQDIPSCQSNMALLPTMKEIYFQCNGPCTQRWYKGGIHKLPRSNRRERGNPKCP